MAVDAAALNLADYAKLSNSPLVRQITFSLIDQGSVLADIPLINKKTLIANGVRFSGDNLPTVGWRKINEEPAVTKGTPTAYQEQVYIISNNIDVDRMLVEEENAIVDPRAIQIQAYTRALTYDINDKFINNSHVTGDMDAPVGLRARLDDPTLYGPESEMKIDAGAVDISNAGLTAATANNFLLLLDTLLDYLNAGSGNGVVLYMNDNMKRRFARAIRVLGGGAGFSTTQDAFGRSVDVYKGARIHDVGRKADQTTRVITSTENSSGVDGSDVHTSIYGVKYGEEAFTGWQYEPFNPVNLGLMDNGVIYRTSINWAFGLMMVGTRSVARLYGIKVA